ncbi:hypothetical protein IQ244_09525 [Nostoc sp. LEGE 06077]|nr:hypothetical protein [Nostoc sp. LEGE 06077]
MASIEEGADLAVERSHIESGKVCSWSFVKRFLSCGTQMLRLIIRLGVLGNISDPMSGYLMVCRSLLTDVTFNHYFTNLIENTHYCNYLEFCV